MKNGNGTSPNSNVTPEWLQVAKTVPKHAPARGFQHISELNYADQENAAIEASQYRAEPPAFTGQVNLDFTTMKQIAESMGYSQEASPQPEQRPNGNPAVLSGFKDHVKFAGAPVTGSDLILSEVLTNTQDHLGMLARGRKPTQENKPQSKTETRSPKIEQLVHNIKLGNYRRNKTEKTHEQVIASKNDTQEAEALLGQEAIQKEFNPFRRTSSQEARRIASTAWGLAELRNIRKRLKSKKESEQQKLAEPTTKPQRGKTHRGVTNADAEKGKNTSSGSGHF